MFHDELVFDERHRIVSPDNDEDCVGTMSREFLKTLRETLLESA